MSETVELHQAFSWDCPQYGRENFARAVTCEQSPDEQLALAKRMGLVDADASLEDAAGVLVLPPDQVKCFDCGATFDTEEQT